MLITKVENVDESSLWKGPGDYSVSVQIKICSFDDDAQLDIDFSVEDQKQFNDILHWIESGPVPTDLDDDLYELVSEDTIDYLEELDDSSEYSFSDISIFEVNKVG